MLPWCPAHKIRNCYNLPMGRKWSALDELAIVGVTTHWIEASYREHLSASKYVEAYDVHKKDLEVDSIKSPEEIKEIHMMLKTLLREFYEDAHRTRTAKKAWEDKYIEIRQVKLSAAQKASKLQAGKMPYWGDAVLHAYTIDKIIDSRGF